MAMVKRKIHFFSADFMVGLNGQKVDEFKVFEHIKSLGFLDRNAPGESRYMYYKDKRIVMMECDTKDGKITGKISNVRMSSLPAVECKGSSRELPIGDDEGIEEPSHFVYFPDTKILAMEYNHYGPRSGMLGAYIGAKGNPLVTSVKFNFLLNREALNKLNSLKEIKLIDLKIKCDRAQLTEQLEPSLHSAIKAASQIDSMKNYELILRPVKGEGSGKKIVQSIADFLLDEDHRDVFSKVKIHGKESEEESTKTFDALQDKLEAEEEIISEGRSRAIKSENMYRAIINAYNQKQSYLAGLTKHD